MNSSVIVLKIFLSKIKFDLKLTTPPTHPLRPVKRSNTCASRITAAAGTRIGQRLFLNNVIIFFRTRALRLKRLLHSHNMAGSDLRPLPKIPHCWFQMELGPYLSSHVTVQPLRTVKHVWFGKLLISPTT